MDALLLVIEHLVSNSELVIGIASKSSNLVPRLREEGKSGLVPIAFANYPKKTWGSEYDRTFSVFASSIHPSTTPYHQTKKAK